MKNAAKSAKSTARKPGASTKAAPRKVAKSKVKKTTVVKSKGKPKKDLKVKSPVRAESKSKETITPPVGPEIKEQSQTFDKAMALFHKRDFARAKELFQKAASGPVVEMAHAAQMRIRICESRLADSGPVLKTLEDHYNYGITLMNRGDLETAQNHLRRAVSGNAKADHFHYAMALCSGLMGDISTSVAHLKKAIELAPGNRIAARNDTEFKSLVAHPALREILYPERSSAG